MFYTLIDPKLLEILKQKKIDGIKIYEKPSYKQVTFYIPHFCSTSTVST